MARDIGGDVANKKKSTNAHAPKKKAPAKKPVARKKAVPARRSPAPTLDLTASSASALTGAISPQCPTHVYLGVLDLEDDNLQAFLTTGGQTYLLALDPDCSGTFNTGRVTAAYNAFKDNPGPHGSLTCNGFIHADGTGLVLHVVS